MPYSLTPVMTDCARVIGELTDTLGRPPLIAEIGRPLGLSTNSGRVFALVEALLERGWLDRGAWERQPGRPLVLLYRPPPVAAGQAKLEAVA